MFPELGDQERERVKEIINRLIAINFLIKELDREKYILARRYREPLETFFKFLGWEIFFDDRHDCVFVSAPDASFTRSLTQDESIWFLVLRLIYQEKRQGLSLSEFPVTTLNEIRSKYATFRLPIFNKTLLQKLVKLGEQYCLMQALDEDIYSDDSAFRLFHSMLYVIKVDDIEKLHQRIYSYQIQKEEGLLDEMVETPAVD